jgi:hypothetical protein
LIDFDFERMTQTIESYRGGSSTGSNSRCDVKLTTAAAVRERERERERDRGSRQPPRGYITALSGLTDFEYLDVL